MYTVGPREHIFLYEKLKIFVFVFLFFISILLTDILQAKHETKTN